MHVLDVRLLKVQSPDRWRGLAQAVSVKCGHKDDQSFTLYKRARRRTMVPCTFIFVYSYGTLCARVPLQVVHAMIRPIAPAPGRDSFIRHTGDGHGVILSWVSWFQVSSYRSCGSQNDPMQADVLTSQSTCSSHHITYTLVPASCQPAAIPSRCAACWKFTSP